MNGRKPDCFNTVTLTLKIYIGMRSIVMHNIFHDKYFYKRLYKFKNSKRAIFIIIIFKLLLKIVNLNLRHFILLIVF